MYRQSPVLTLLKHTQKVTRRALCKTFALEKCKLFRSSCVTESNFLALFVTALTICPHFSNNFMEAIKKMAEVLRTECEKKKSMPPIQRCIENAVHVDSCIAVTKDSFIFRLVRLIIKVGRNYNKIIATTHKLCAVQKWKVKTLWIFSKDLFKFHCQQHTLNFSFTICDEST